MNIGILGSGIVAKTLAAGFLQHGHNILVGSRTPSKWAPWLAEHPGAKAGTFAEAAAFAEVIVLAVKGAAAREALDLAGAETLAGKIVIDTTNPIDSTPPVNGVLHFFTTLNESLMEQLQKAHPRAKFVKAFSCVGSAHMVHPALEGERPTMFLCGNDEEAKRTVIGLLDSFGWDTADMGQVEAARAIEPLCMLWCIPGFLRNEWNHAFRLLKK